MDGVREFVRQESPLAEAVLRVCRHAFGEAASAAPYEEHRGRCYERRLTFPALLDLLLDALAGHGGGGHAAFDRARREGRPPVAEANVYAKLGRLPLDVSKAFVREAGRRLARCSRPTRWRKPHGRRRWPASRR